MAQSCLANSNLAVGNVQTVYQFYANLFGLAEEPAMSHPPDFRVLDAGGCTLSFQPAQAVGLPHEPAGGLELGFEVADVSAVAALLQQLGGKIKRCNQMHWGESVDAYDLDGYPLTLYQRS